jgi:hypothetical protein
MTMMEWSVELLNALQMRPLTNQEKAANCLTLADILDNVDEDAFDMGYWVSKTECGTTACALGHAVLSGMIPGVEAAHKGQRPEYEAWHPRVEGSGDFVLWEAVGEVFFGRDACERIFYDTCPRDAWYVAVELREEASRLLGENGASLEENDDE